MSGSRQNPRRGRLRFPLWYLIVITAIAAVWTAAMVARTKHAVLETQHELLAKMDSSLDVVDPTKLTVVQLPGVAPDFKSWNVHVPSGPAWELRFSAGNLSTGGPPPNFESVELSPGRHQIIFNEQDSHGQESFFRCYVDGQLKLDKRMGPEWLPDGWRQASSYHLPNNLGPTRQLSGRRYMSRMDFGRNKYFNGTFDQWSTEPSYLLWLDRADQIPEPISPFLGFTNNPYSHAGNIGFRDGPRFHEDRRVVGFDLNFSHPANRTRKAALRIQPEFLNGDNVVLSNQSPGTITWKLSNAADRIEPLKLNPDPAIKSQTAFLHATGVPAGAPEPVIELCWDLDHPNEIGLRLAVTQANASLTRWRLRCPDGLSHLWRLIDSGDTTMDSRKIAATHFSTSDDKEEKEAHPSDLKATVMLDSPNEGMQTIRWKTDVVDPLQIHQKDKALAKQFAGVSLYQGLPVEFSLKLPAAATPKVWAQRLDQLPGPPTAPIPGGSIFGDITIEIDAKNSSWIWLSID